MLKTKDSLSLSLSASMFQNPPFIANYTHYHFTNELLNLHRLQEIVIHTRYPNVVYELISST